MQAVKLKKKTRFRKKKANEITMGKKKKKKYSALAVYLGQRKEAREIFRDRNLKERLKKPGGRSSSCRSAALT